MIDPELQHYLSGINQHLVDIKKNQKHGIWRSLFNGIFTAIGYAIGLAIVITILSFILRQTGYWDKFKQQAKDVGDIMDQIKNFKEPFGQTGERTIILPDGREVKISQ